MKKLFILFIFLASESIILAIEYNLDSTIQAIPKRFEKVNKIVSKQKNICVEAISKNEQKNCSEVSDSFCDSLWSPENNGNLSLGDSNFLLGKTKNSEILNAERIDLEALIDSEKKLPIDLKRRLKGPFEKLKRVLENEKDSRIWYRELGRAKEDIYFAVEDVARGTVLKKHPHLKSKKEKDYTVEERALFVHGHQSLKNKLLEAKYKEHPNWKRVERLSSQAKEDILSSIQDLNLPEDYKKRIIKKISAVELSLPYSDPRVLSNNVTCGTTQNNAFYTGIHNKFTICAGMFNTLRSDGSLYQTIAHEIAHAIDPNGILNDHHHESDSKQVLNRITNAKGKVIECGEWEKIKGSSLSPLKEIKPLKLPIRKLQSCLIDKSDLYPFETQRVKDVSKRHAANSINNWASDNDFTLLAKPTVIKNGVEVPNEYYLRADRINLLYNEYFPKTAKSNWPGVPEIFVQELSCQKDHKNEFIDYQGIEESERSQIFESAITNTKEVITGLNERYYSICGNECKALAQDNLARSTQENFADWLSFKALEKRVAKKDNYQDKLSFVKESGALDCKRPGVSRDSPVLTAVEKKYSYAVHGDSRVRRLSSYTKKISEELDCKQDEDVKKGYGSCEL